jgi:hypothetical protein
MDKWMNDQINVIKRENQMNDKMNYQRNKLRGD